METWQQRLTRRFYLDQPGWINGTEEFWQLCKKTIPAGSKILEIGAGPDNRTSRFLATLGELHGIDPSPEVRENTSLASATLLAGDRYPFDDSSFDACVSDYVVEHIPNPKAHLDEVKRILKPGAPYLFRTPNRLHYVFLVASATPHWFHMLLANRLRNMPDQAHDPYPTIYKMNSRSAVEQLARESGLSAELISLIEKEPSYGMAAQPLFFAFMAYERLVNSSEALAPFRAQILGVLRRPSV
jgi:SAM-dependent methyltransferase